MLNSKYIGYAHHYNVEKRRHVLTYCSGIENILTVKTGYQTLLLLDGQSGKAFLNRCVFTMFLNVSTEVASLMCLSSEFHRVGAPTLKDLSAKVLHLVLGTLRCK